MPKLTLVATPIGNLGDLSPRAVEALRLAEFWIVEDSRVSGKLASHLQIKKSMRVLNDHSTDVYIQKLLTDIQKGDQCCLITDGGAPVVSDPGAILCDRCHDAGIEVDSVPGPSAVINALSLSGFFGQRFAFLGFLGRKPGPMKEELLPFADSPLTLILFESPHRIEALLKAAYDTLGTRRYVICREMTKSYQQVYRDVTPNVPDETSVPRKGEVTIVIEGRRKKR
jgi:16S rRNA (cytidine1402-2'-O)-methyltransferase